MPVYLYYGDEPYLLNRAVKKLRDSVVQPDMGALCHKVARDASLAQAQELVGGLTLGLGGDTLIELQGFWLLEKSPQSDADKKDLEALKQLLEGIEPAKHILFVAKKADKRMPFTKWLCGNSGVTVREFKQLEFWKVDDAVHLLIQEARAQQVVIEPNAALLLVEQLGMELQGLMTEVQKLSVYAANRSITRQDVQQLCQHNENTFQMLADWVQGSKRAEIFQILEELLLRQHPVQLFALAQTYVGNLFRLRVWQQAGLSHADMAERTKKNAFKIKKDLQDFARVPFERLARLKTGLLDLEWKMKTGQLDDHLAIEMLMAL